MSQSLIGNPRVKLPVESPHDRSVLFINTPNFPLFLITAVLNQKVNSHELLTLTFAGKLTSSTDAVVSGDPVQFTWTSGFGKSTFVGYVHSIKPTDVNANVTEIYCVSPSYLLKNTDQKVYKNVTADAVVSKIAAKYGLKAITQRHPRVFPSLVNAGQSDWQFLKQLANLTGFLLKTEGTTLYFMSKSKLESATRKGAPYFYKEDHNPGSRFASSFGTVVSFSSTLSDDAPDMFGATVDRVVSGIHRTNNSLISSTHTPKVGSKSTKGVVVPSTAYLNGEI
jgi:hypothetical protein